MASSPGVHQVETLTKSQQLLIKKLVELQEKYELPSMEDMKKVMPFSLGNKQEHYFHRYLHMVQLSTLTIRLVFDFANGIPFFKSIPKEYKMSLMKASLGEILILRAARRYDPGTDTIVFANNQPYTRQNFRSACIGDLTDYIFDFCKLMWDMRIDNAEYALLAVITILSKRPFLLEERRVKELREFYIETLWRRIATNRSADKGFFIRWLHSIRGKLRHIGMMKSENNFALVVQNKQLYPLLEDIWDIILCYPRYQCLIKRPLARKLSKERGELIYNLAVFQDTYEFPSEESLKTVTAFSLGDTEEDQLKRIQHMTDITNLTVQLIVEFAKRVPGFNKIPREDQATLLKACFSEVIVLKLARRYDPGTDSIVFANNQPYTKENFASAFTGDFSHTLLNFCRTMYNLKVNNGEYALLSVILLFSERPSLQEPKKVSSFREFYMETLLAHITTNRPESDSNFNRLLLSRLFILRKLGSMNLEQYLSFKMRNNIKISPFLEEFLNHQE